ncbi:ferredoxin [Phytohabitans suffuscus]|uniref:Ferredoxin n=1 Tax=Phytohabitans suffuscus TaxID=624315 RepID=A0A6F8YUK3_9ACTN|nr:ferredoxin [Phytohabitans suffuscus]BCB89817.1 ferredoxin [Phytohabitans suffuscus]
MNFVIDTSLCSGHGRCYTLAPEWFDADDIGYGQVKDAPVPDGERARTADIVAACPEGAISVKEG